MAGRGGLQKIAYLGGKTLVESEVMERARAYRETMKKYGLPEIVQCEVVIHGASSRSLRRSLRSIPIWTACSFRAIR